MHSGETSDNQTSSGKGSWSAQYIDMFVLYREYQYSNTSVSAHPTSLPRSWSYVLFQNVRIPESSRY